MYIAVVSYWLAEDLDLGFIYTKNGRETKEEALEDITKMLPEFCAKFFKKEGMPPGIEEEYDSWHTYFQTNPIKENDDFGNFIDYFNYGYDMDFTLELNVIEVEQKQNQNTQEDTESERARKRTRE